MTRKKAGLLIFNGVEVLDFCGPYEVFTILRLDEEKRLTDPSPFEALLIAETGAPVTASGGMRVIPDFTFEDCPPLDLLVVPGGLGVRSEIQNEKTIGWIAGQGKRVELLTSVCTGSMLLAKAGLLDGRRATTHLAALDWMRQSFPKVRVEQGVRVVDEGNVITSAGVAAGIDMALSVAARFFGSEVARAAARRMEYPYAGMGNVYAGKKERM